MSFWYLVVHVDLSEAGADAKAGVGFFLLGWTIFTLYMTIAAWRTTSALFGVFVLLSLTFLALSAGHLGAGAGLNVIGGWLGLLTAVGRLVLRRSGSDQRDLEAHRPAGRSAKLVLSSRPGRQAAGSSRAGRPVAPTRASSDSPSVRASAATVKNAGVGIRPVSILRRVSAEIPAAPATATMLRSPRACRSSRPSRSPRS